MTRIRHATRALALGATALSLALAAPMVSAQKPVTIRIAADHGAPPHPAAITEEFFKERLAQVIPGSELRIFTAGALNKIPAETGPTCTSCAPTDTGPRSSRPGVFA